MIIEYFINGHIPVMPFTCNFAWRHLYSFDGLPT